MSHYPLAVSILECGSHLLSSLHTLQVIMILDPAQFLLSAVPFIVLGIKTHVFGVSMTSLHCIQVVE